MRHDIKIHVVVSVIALTTSLGWLALFWLTPLAQTFICGPNGLVPQIPPWDATHAIALILMWALMSTTMMLPCITAPLLAAIRPRRAALLVPALYFVLGYIAITTLTATGAALIEWTLASTGLIQAGTPSHPLLTATFLLAAMLLAAASIAHTRPTPQPTAPFLQGLHHAKSHFSALLTMVCLQFSGGTMNLTWMAIIALWMFIGTTMPIVLGGARGPIDSQASIS